MAITAFPSIRESPDLILLNVSRLFTRLEHNLLSPGSELRTLRKSEFQRMRVAKNVEYARTLLSQLERSLPQLKQLNRRHEAQAEIARDRQLLKRIQILLDEEEARAEEYEEEGDDEADDEWKELFVKPVAEERVVSTAGGQGSTTVHVDKGLKDEVEEPATATIPATTTTPPAPTSTSPPEPASTLRNRHTRTQPSEPAAKTTSHKPIPTPSYTPQPTKPQETEAALSAHRSEQEDLTNSLLALATQLKVSSQTFHSTLENERSVLDRAVSGMDKTSASMEAAGQRMGMLRKMSEGKGWWGRMMLYAWIFGLWVVAILIVFVGPKMRF